MTFRYSPLLLKESAWNGKYYICVVYDNLLIDISDQLLITKLYNSFIKVDACGKILSIGKVHGGLEKV